MDGAHVPQVLQPGLQHEPGREEGLGQLAEDQAVVARVGLGEAREPAAALVVEGAAVDDDPADGGAVAADELGGRVHHDVGAVAKGLAQVRRGHGVVHHQGDPVLVGDGRHVLEVEDVTLGVAERLGVEGLGVGPDGGPPGVEVVGVVDEGDLDPELGQRVVEQVVGAAVQGGRRDHVAAVLGQVEQGDGLGRLAAGHGQRRHPALEGGHPLLEDGLGRVHDPGVDVAQLLQPEQGGGVGGVAEGVAGGLVDRHGPGPGGGVGHGSGVDLTGLESPVGHGSGLLGDGPCASFDSTDRRPPVPSLANPSELVN